ncbi:MAG: O-antigen ligase domain-containing protein [Alphaproteobacteria bacterium]|nr:MAG: O-antigen ligase domain-containing protein [Alphaproteobacteria bacterium]
MFRLMVVLASNRASRSDQRARRGATFAHRDITGKLGHSERLFLLLVLFSICIVPSRLSWIVSDLRISPARLVILLSIVPLAWIFLNSIVRGRSKFCLTDGAVLFFGAWFFVAVWITNGMATAFSSSAIVVVELVGTYLIGRVIGGTADGVRTLATGLAWCVAFCVAMGIVDTLTSQHFINSLAAATTHNDPTFLQYRAGILRAESTFDHPILFGTFCVFGFVIIFKAGRNGVATALPCALCVVGLIIAMSSGPLLGFVIALGGLAYSAMAHAAKDRWRVAFLLGGAIAVVTFIALPAILPVFIDNLTLEPGTGKFRLLIWQYAGREVWNSPLWGIGFKDWLRPETIGGATFGSSVDSFWLYWALKAGIPGVLALAIAIVSSALQGRQKPARDGLGGLRDALTICLIVVIAVGFTVHFYHNIWLLLGLLLGTRATLGRRDYSSSSLSF